MTTAEPPFPPDAVLRLKSDVRFRQVGDEGIVVRQTEGEVVVTNEVGAVVMRLLDGRRSLTEIIAEIGRDYDVTEDALSGDVYEFVRELLDSGIAERTT